MTVFFIIVIALCLAVIAYICNDWRNERRISRSLRRDLADERRWSDTVSKKRGEALTECEQLADENASLAHDIAALRKCTVAYVFSDWERIDDVSGVRDYYLEKDGMRIIIEDGKATSGFYSKEGPGEYVKPAAKVVEGDIV